MSSAPRLLALGAVLRQYQDYWRPAPFWQRHPAWCDSTPDLAAAVMALNDAETEILAADNARLWRWLARYMPDWAHFAELCALPAPRHDPIPDFGRRSWHIPGRKQAQIQAFADVLGEPVAAIVEWCSGKGHLGRHLGSQWRLPVLSLELDADLCAAGQDFADQMTLDQTFLQADALAPDSAAHLAQRHAVALHACGDLHRALLVGAKAHGAAAIDLVPCCYYRINTPCYQPFNPEADVPLSQSDLHLAVTETTTAGGRERRQRDVAMALKLGYLAWCHDHGDVSRQAGLKPVPAAWNRRPFADYVQAMAARDGLGCDARADWQAYAETGRTRQKEVMRLSLIRLAFRRPLEIWLALDQALYLERAGYAVTLREFCAPGLTPRNLLLSARRQATV